jgi:mannose-6-phosphate isomerase-like protein (cupin superfamily)
MKLLNLSSIEPTAVSHNQAIKKRVMLSEGELANVIQFAQSVFPVGAVAEKHVHKDMGEVFFVESGTGQMEINGISYALEPGTCVVVEPGESHEICNTGLTDLVITYFGVEVQP